MQQKIVALSEILGTTNLKGVYEAILLKKKWNSMIKTQEMDIHNQNDDKYDDVLQVFIVELLSATTPNPRNVKDIWYLDISPTNQLINKKDWLCNYMEVRPLFQ